MGSNSKSDTTTTTQTTTMDASLTNGEGVQILDSIIVDASPDVVKETVKQVGASFEVMMAEDTIQLQSLLDLGSQLLGLADTQQIRLEGQAYHQLESGVRMLEAQQAAGKYVIDLVDETATRTFNLADSVTGGNHDLTAQALDLVKQVKTESYSDTLQTVTFFMIVFGLGAIFMLQKGD